MKPGHPSFRNASAHGIEEGDLDVEEQEDHRHEIELHRVALARVADGRHAAFVGRELLGRGILGAEEQGRADHRRGKPDAEADHDDYAQPAVHVPLNAMGIGATRSQART